MVGIDGNVTLVSLDFEVVEAVLAPQLPNIEEEEEEEEGVVYFVLFI